MGSWELMELGGGGEREREREREREGGGEKEGGRARMELGREYCTCAYY